MSEEFALGFGDSVRLFRQSGFVIEDFVEPRPGPGSQTEFAYVTVDWARRLPAKQAWKVRKASG